MEVTEAEVLDQIPSSRTRDLFEDDAHGRTPAGAGSVREDNSQIQTQRIQYNNFFFKSI